ncbi:MAG: TIGR00730 family Rossman fold protein, partial [Alphaproteobacteria bacterium]|nr:TIGR00730 family Rossman fold protein [Alphaproteobacteria bacterium]
TDNMHDRKQKMAEMSDAFLIMPGGLGTLEETFEILTWKQLGLHEKPVIIADIGGYWRHLTDLVDHMIDESYAKPENRALFQVIDSVDELLPVLSAMPAFDPGVEAKWL